jgi:hypothetical protein
MGMEYIKFLKVVCGKLVLTTLLTFGSPFVTSGNSYGKQDCIITVLFKATAKHKIFKANSRGRTAIKQYLQF